MDFLVRLPIHDSKGKLFGYELKGEHALATLLSMDSPQHGTETEEAMGHHLIGSDLRVFVEIDERTPLPHESSGRSKHPIVFMVDEPMLQELSVDSHHQLERSGYQLATQGLDVLFSLSFGQKMPTYVLIEEGDLSSLDRAMVKRAEEFGMSIMMCGVDRRSQYQEGIDKGIHLFKGNYFKVPDIQDDVPLPMNQVVYFQLLKELRQPDLDLKHLEQIIERDATLTFKLMQFINSAHFGTRFRIRTIKHGLSLLGEHEIQKWATMIVVGLMAQSGPQELLTTALIRARFCEEMADHTGQERLKQESFFLGMISVLDAMLNRPMTSLLKQLPISSLIAEALLGSTQNQLALLLQLIIDYEQANWFRLTDSAHRLKVAEDLVVQTYFNAVEFASQDV